MMRAMEVQRLRELVTRQDSASAQRFIGMGFTLRHVTVSEEAGDDDGVPPGYRGQVLVQADFICTCGKRERFSGFVLPEAITRGGWTIFRELDCLGSMSRSHLLEDGYTDEQIDDMERRCAEHLERDGRWRMSVVPRLPQVPWR